MGVEIVGAIGTAIGVIVVIVKFIKNPPFRCCKKQEEGNPKKQEAGRELDEYWVCEKCNERVERKAVCIKCGKIDPALIPNGF